MDKATAEPDGKARGYRTPAEINGVTAMPSDGFGVAANLTIAVMMAGGV